MAQVLVEGLSMPAGELTKQENVEAAARLIVDRIVDYLRQHDTPPLPMHPLWDAVMEAFEGLEDALRELDLEDMPQLVLPLEVAQ